MAGLLFGAILSAFRGQYGSLPRAESPARIPAPSVSPGAAQAVAEAVKGSRPAPIAAVQVASGSRERPTSGLFGPSVIERLNRLMGYADTPVVGVEPAPVGTVLRVPGVVTSIRHLRQGGYVFALEDPRYPGVRVPVWVSDTQTLAPTVGDVVIASGVRIDGELSPGLARAQWFADPALFAEPQPHEGQFVH